MDFFDLKLSQASTVRRNPPIVTQSQSPPQNRPRILQNAQILSDLKKLQDFSNKNDLKKVSSSINDVKTKASNLINTLEKIQQELTEAKEENSRTSNELALVKDDARESE